MSKRLTIFLVIFFSLALVFSFLAIKYIKDNKEGAKPQYYTAPSQNIVPNNQVGVANNNQSTYIPENNNLSPNNQEILVDNSAIKTNEDNQVVNDTPSETKTEAPRKNVIIRIIEALLERLGFINSVSVSENDIDRYNELARDNQDLFDEFGNPYKTKTVSEEKNNVEVVVNVPESNQDNKTEQSEITPENKVTQLENLVEQLENKLTQLENKVDQPEVKEVKVEQPKDEVAPQENNVALTPQENTATQPEVKDTTSEEKIVELENLVEQLEKKLAQLEKNKPAIPENKVTTYNPIVKESVDGTPSVKRYVYVPRLSTEEGTEHLRGILEEIAAMETFNIPVESIRELEGIYDPNKVPVKLTNEDKKTFQDAVHWLISEKEKELINNNKFVWSTYNYDENLDITFDVLSRNYLRTKVRWVVKVEDPIIALRWFDDNTRSWKRVDTIDSKYAVITNELPNDIYGIICIRQSVDGYNWSPITIKSIDVEKETADRYFDSVSKI